MDPVTHTLVGWMIARAGASRLEPRATATLLVAANVPDLDTLYLLGGAAAYFQHHHAWTHSLAGALLLGAAVGLAVWRLAGNVPGPFRPAGPRLLLAAGLGAASHLLLDWMTPAGAMLLWPVNENRFSLDWFAADLFLLLIPLLGLGLPALFRLIAEEIGARRNTRGVRRAAWVTLTVCALLAAGRASLHSEAVAELESRLYRERTPVRVAAFPTALNPFRWEGVVETATTYEIVEVRLLETDRSPEARVTLYKPSHSPALEVALATRTAQLFLARARFPYVELLPAMGEGWEVRLQDLSASSRWLRGRTILARIDLSAKLEVEGESFSFGGAGEETPP